MKQCTQCGAYSDDSAKFCTSCGQPFGEEATEVQPAYYAADESISEVYTPKVTTKKEFLDLPENAPAKRTLKTSGIFCYFCAGVTLVFGIATGNYLSVVDFLILLVLGLFIHLKQSKVCAILLAAYAALNVIIGLIAYHNFRGVLIILAAVYAVTSAFKLDKSWKEYQAK
ncbi:MAG: zinc ribbon domain-containing protein [Oscillospiraceae bacterium]|nr:zinc ribbon domain-containing protein [Oscillospiraceae bacterium]